MTDNLVTPERTVTVGDKQFKLDPSFATLKALQHGLGRELVRLLISLPDLSVDQIALFIATASGDPKKADEIAQTIIDEWGLFGVEYSALKAELTGWLDMAIAPKRDREKKAEAIDEMIRLVREERAKRDSLGANTSGSASASSGGRRKPSGAATSGK